MSLVRMDIQTVVVGTASLSSLVVLRPHRRHGGPVMQLPIRIGTVESTSISMGVKGTPRKRPVTHDLMRDMVAALGASVSSVVITDVQGTTFFAQIRLRTAKGEIVAVDSRPSDAIALAVRTHAPIFAEDQVLETAAMPDFKAVREDEERQEIERFHDFVENLTPDDFNTPSGGTSRDATTE